MPGFMPGIHVLGISILTRKTWMAGTKPGHNNHLQFTPNFFCRLEDDVVYWNTTRLSGNT
jgi:hypothetical protein